MRRLAAVAATIAVAALVLVPATLAADGEATHTGRVLMAAGGDITLPAGEQADAVIVIDGTATVAGDVNTIVVINGQARLDGATTETIVAIGSPLELGPDTVVTGDIMKFDSLVTKFGNADVQGGIRDIGSEVTGVGFFLGPLFLLLFAGFALAAIAAGLLLAGLAGRQVRAAEALISREPLMTFAAGLAATFLPILVIVGLFVTVIGAPLAMGILFGLWPLAAFVGYLVAGIWVGDWLLRFGSRTETPRERPYLAAVLGLIALQALAIWPFLPMIASLFGTGAVVRLAWQTLRGEPTAPAVRMGAPAPVAG
jgi:hypothetical protein